MLRSMDQSLTRSSVSLRVSLGLWVHPRTGSLHCKYKKILRGVSGGSDQERNNAVGIGDSPIHKKK